jgi:hypothetical protein
MARMKVAQINKPGANFELVERDIPEPGLGEVRIKVEACGICHSDRFVKEGLWPGSPIRESLDMRLRGSSMRSEPTPAFGRSANTLVSDGMAAIVFVAKLVDAEISSSANQEKLRVSVTMVVLQSMSSLRQRQLLPDPKTFRLKRQRRCFVLVLPCSTRFGIPEQDPEISSQSRASVVGTSGDSIRESEGVCHGGSGTKQGQGAPRDQVGSEALYRLRLECSGRRTAKIRRCARRLSNCSRRPINIGPGWWTVGEWETSDCRGSDGAFGDQRSRLNCP